MRVHICALLLLAVVQAEKWGIRTMQRNLGRSSDHSDDSHHSEDEDDRDKVKGGDSEDEIEAEVIFEPEDDHDSVTVVCAQDALLTQKGYERCQEKCDEARCCFLRKGDRNTCIDEENCTPYKNFCPNLKILGDPSDNDNSDSGSSRSGKDEDGSGDSDDEIEALFYQPKRNRGPPKLTTVAPEDLYIHCKTENLMTRNGYRTCKKLCRPAKCCHSKEGNCWDANAHVCATYHACESLEEKKGQFKLEDDSHDIKEEARATMASKSIDEACHVDNVIANGVGHSECYQKCEDARALCCFKNGKHNCSKEKRQVCEEYAACEVLFDVDPDLVPETCTGDNIKRKGNGWKMCKDACDLAECCFAPMYASGESTNCYTEMQEFCDDFQWCEELEDGYIDTQDLYAEDIKSEGVSETKNLEEMCALEHALTQKGYMECNGECSDYSCCFSDEECPSHIDCTGKEPCELFFYVGVDMVKTACTANTIKEKDGLELCQTICDQHECCKTGSCHFFHDSCNHYEQCSILEEDADGLDGKHSDDEEEEEDSDDSEKTNGKIKEISEDTDES